VRDQPLGELQAERAQPRIGRVGLDERDEVAAGGTDGGVLLGEELADVRLAGGGEPRKELLLLEGEVAVELLGERGGGAPQETGVEPIGRERAFDPAPQGERRFVLFMQALAPIEPDVVAMLGDLGDRVLLGSDFPNIPYPYAEQLDALVRFGLGDDWLRAVCWTNGARLLGLPDGP